MWGWLHFYILSMISAGLYLQIPDPIIYIFILIVTSLSLYNDTQTNKLRMRCTMTYKIYTKDKNGDVEVFDSVSNKNDAVSAVKLAESYWVYIDAWYVRTD